MCAKQHLIGDNQNFFSLAAFACFRLLDIQININNNTLGFFPLKVAHNEAAHILSG